MSKPSRDLNFWDEFDRVISERRRRTEKDMALKESIEQYLRKSATNEKDRRTD